MTVKNNRTLSEQGTGLSKYSNIIIYIVLLIVSVGGLFLYNIYMSSQLAKITTDINLASRQSVLVQQMAKEVMNVDLMTDDILAKVQAVANELPQEKPAPYVYMTPQMVAQQESARIAERENREREALQASDGIHNAIEQLKQSKSIFDQTLLAFANGGETISLTNETIRISKIINADGEISIKNSQELWAPYLRLMDSFIDNLQTGKIDKDAIGFTVDYARTFNNQLYYETNDLVKALEAEAQAKTKTLQTVQTIGIGVSVLFFLLIVFGSLRQLMHTDKQLAIAQRQTDDIMNTVNEGLFLIDRDLVIADQYSGKLEEILNQKQIAGRTLFNILEGMISQKDMDTTKLFVEQLYNTWVVEELIQDLNPLKQVLLSHIDENGVSATKYLEFNFLRVLDGTGENVESVFVSVTDITKEVNLQAQMQKDKEQHNRQIEMISYLLSVDGNQLAYFIRETKARIERMNEVLKHRNTGDLKQKAEILYRETHSLKGDASAVHLSALVDIASKQEDKLRQLLQHTTLKGNDFLPFTVGLDEMVAMVSFIDSLLQRLNIQGSSGINQAFLSEQETKMSKPAPAPTETVAAEFDFNDEPTIAPAQKGYWQGYFENYAKDIANRQNKQVAVTVLGFDDTPVSDGRMPIYKDIAVQLLKNAIVHGIESASLRSVSGKDNIGKITLALIEDGDHQKVVVSDDGAGINWEKIRQKAVEIGQVSPADADKLTAKELLRFMFSSGLSTADKQDEDAGRGVGMDIVKTLATEHRAKIGVNSRPTQFTEISISFPKE